MSSKIGNVITPARWSLKAAELEFGLTAETISHRLRDAREKPDISGAYSTSQILRGLYGDSHAEERRQETRQRRIHWEIRNQVMRAELLDRELLTQALSRIFGAISALIVSAPIPKQVKDDLLQNISTYPLAIQSVAQRQTKQIHLPDDGPNGEETGDEAENPPSQHKARRIKRARIES
jgi:hypothetical protein